MDKIDKAILRAAQSKLPIHPRPFAKLGESLGLGEDEVIERLKKLKERGVIRRIGGNFFSHRLGFSSTLCAARVPKEKLESFVQAVNAHPGVTHNYLREHPYNVWFTFIAESMDYIESCLEDLRQKTGVDDICSFPAKKLFKIKVDFPV